MTDYRKSSILRIFFLTLTMALLVVGGAIFINLNKSLVIKNYSQRLIDNYQKVDLCEDVENYVHNYYYEVLEYENSAVSSEREEKLNHIKSYERFVNESKGLLESAFIEDDVSQFVEIINSNIDFLITEINVLLNKSVNGFTAADKIEICSQLDKNITIINNNLAQISLIYKTDIVDLQNKLDEFMIASDHSTFLIIFIIITITLICIFLCIRIVNEVADRDLMTGLYNQEGLIKYGVMLSVQGKLSDYIGIHMHIKNFQYINKKVGSKQGDKIIIDFSDQIKLFIGKNGRVARVGGDFFSILIQKSEIDDFLFFLSNIEGKAYVAGELTKIALPTRCGIYSIKKGDSMGDVLNNTLIAYNVAKYDGGEDYTWFDGTMLEKVMAEKETLISFPKALKENEFVVFYQPKVDLDTNKLNGCEALVRWKKSGKCINPSEFVPVLEKEGNIIALDFYVFETVCKDLRRWIDKGLQPVKVSSNFSKKHLHNNHLAEDILRILIKYNIDCKYIEIELTETSAYEDFENLKLFVNQMKMAGISVSIDDFGTGYSSLTLLKDLDVNVIKLDKSFINRIDEDNELDQIMIGNTVHMIHDLNRNVICEGVETKKQAAFLKSVQCLNVQGYLYDKPLEADDFEKRLEKPVYDL